MQKYSRRNVLLLYLVAGLTSVSHAALELIFPLNLERLGHPLPLIGVTVALMGVGALGSRIPGGVWYRLNRARGLCVGALTLNALSTIGPGIGAAWGIQAGSMLVNGFAYGLATTFLMALLIDVRPEGEAAATTMAWYTAILSTAYAAGSTLGAQSILWFGHDAAFVIAGVVGLGAAALALTFDPPVTVTEMSDRISTAPPERGLRALLGLPSGVWLAALLALYINVVNDTVGTFFPIYAVGIGMSVASVGYFKSASFMAATAIRFGSAALFRIVDFRAVNHGSIVVMALGVALLSLLTSEWALLTVFIAIGVCRGLLRVTSMAAVAEYRGQQGTSVGMASGIYNAGFDIAALVGAPLAGALAGQYGIPVAFRILALALPAAYYLIWFAQRARGGNGRAVSPPSSF
jgi:predicted MFS family arabinose efflux permease